MCNRFKLEDPPTAQGFIEEAIRVGFRRMDGTLPLRFNIAPQSHIPVMAQGADAAEWRRMVWGLLPIDDRGKRPPRFYTIATRERVPKWSAFRNCAQKRRCLIPADGFYDWKETGGIKYPYLFTVGKGQPFAFAGIWEVADSKTPETVAILTTTPNKLVAPIKDRMPVVLTGEQIPRWLGDQPLSEEEFASLTEPAREDLLSVREVDRYVNNSRNEGADCIAPPKPPPRDGQMNLF